MYFSVEHIKNNEISGACSTYERQEKRIQVFEIDIDIVVNCNWVDTRWQ